MADNESESPETTFLVSLFVGADAKVPTGQIELQAFDFEEAERKFRQTHITEDGRCRFMRGNSFAVIEKGHLTRYEIFVKGVSSSAPASGEIPAHLLPRSFNRRRTL